jgi:predicted nuclease of predicted toxin-antitoxin system
MISSEVAHELADQGYDTLRASETGQNRADDQQILQKAISENRILITLDEHFGDWVILPLSQHPGVIRVKVHPTTSQRVLNLLLPFLRAHTQGQFKGHLVILSEKRAKWMLTAQSTE